MVNEKKTHCICHNNAAVVREYQNTCNIGCQKCRGIKPPAVEIKGGEKDEMQ